MHEGKDGVGGGGEGVLRPASSILGLGITIFFAGRNIISLKKMILSSLIIFLNIFTTEKYLSNPLSSCVLRVNIFCLLCVCGGGKKYIQQGRGDEGDGLVFVSLPMGENPRKEKAFCKFLLRLTFGAEIIKKCQFPAIFLATCIYSYKMRERRVGKSGKRH